MRVEYLTRTRFIMIALAALLAMSMGTVGAQTTYCQPGGTAESLAPWYCSQLNQAITSVWQKWEPVAIITIFLSFFIAALIFMVGIAMRNDGVRNFGVGEMYEASATALIAIFFLTLSAILFGVIPGFFVGPINPYVTALSYISNTVNATQGIIKSLFAVQMTASYFISLKLHIYVYAFGELTAGGFNSATFYEPFAKFIAPFFIVPANTIISMLTDGLIYLSAEFYMILFLMYIAVPVLLIPGIILRAIFPLRGLGGTLIAMALAFYLIMPVLFSVVYYFTNTSMIGTLTAAAAQITANGAGTGAITNTVSATSPLVTQVSNLESSMGAYFLAILFYPALILTIIYVAIVEISGFLGVAVMKSKRLSMV